MQSIAPNVAILHAVVGMVPRGKSELNAAVNAIQLMVAVHREGWRVASLQNTPAAYHGRPEAVSALTAELKELVPRLPPE